MEDIFQFLIKTNTINFLIVLALIVFLVCKLNVKQKIQELREEIKVFVESAENEKIRSEKELSEINNKITGLPREIEDIKESAQRSSESIASKIRRETEEQKHDIENNAKRIFNLETKKFKSKLNTLLSEKSIELAKENAVNQLNSNADLHNKYIDNAIAELDRIVL